MCNVCLTHVRRVVQLGALVLAALLAFSPAVFGQSSTTATIRGTVEDTSGGVLPGATVTITNTGTKAVVDTVTDERGQYLVRSCSPAHTPEGRAVRVQDLRAEGGLRSARTIRAVSTCSLEVGQQTETVTVTAQQEVIQTETGAREGVLTTEADRQPVGHGPQLARTVAHPSRRGHRLQYRRVDRSCQGRPELHRQRHPIVGQHRAARWIEPPRHRLQLRHDGGDEQRHGSGGEGPELQFRGRIRRRRHERERASPRRALRRSTAWATTTPAIRSSPPTTGRTRSRAWTSRRRTTSTPASTSAVRSSSATATRRTRTSCSSSSPTNGSASRSTRAAASRARSRRR